MADQEPKNALLQALAGNGDRLLQVVILVVVALTGGGNFIDIQRAINEIHHIDSIIDESIARQKAINESVNQILKELKERQPSQ